MVGASMPGACVKTLTYVNVCTLNRPGGYEAQAVWSDQPMQYTVPAKFVNYRTVLGTSSPVSNGTVALTSSPVLLETSPNSAPIVVLNVTPNSGIAPVTVNASTAGSSDPDGSIASTTINFGDGTTINAGSGAHTYTAVGTYTVTATVKDNLGATSSAQATVKVSANQPPSVTLGIQPASGQAPLPVTASTVGSLDPDGQIVSTTINFGDGTTVNAATATHTYQTGGTFTVTATVSDDRGATASSSATVSVTAANQAPVAVMNVSTGAVLDATVSLSGSYDPDGSIASSSIDFGDGASAAGLSASHTYATAGTYMITGRVTDDKGLSKTVTQTITIGSLNRPRRPKRAAATPSGKTAERSRGTQ